MKIRTLATIAAASIALIYGIYKYSTADEQINANISYGTPIESYVFKIPGKKDVYLDKALKHFNDTYDKASKEVYYDALKIIKFTMDAKPDRLEEIMYAISDKYMSNEEFRDAAFLSRYTNNQAIVDSIVGQAVDSLIIRNKGEDAFDIAPAHSNREELFNKIKEKTGYPPDSKPMTEEQIKQFDELMKLLFGNDTLMLKLYTPK